MVASGGIFVWKDRRENPDTCTAVVTYPKGFLYTYKTIFGNSYRSFSRIQGRDGTMENYGGEGASLFVVSKEGGRDEFDPFESGPPIVGTSNYLRVGNWPNWYASPTPKHQAVLEFRPRNNSRQPRKIGHVSGQRVSHARCCGSSSTLFLL